MPSDQEVLAARLGLPVSQITPRGILDHEFPGLVDCTPEGPPREAVLQLGAMLMRAGLDDAPEGGSMRYAGQLAHLRAVLADPSVSGPVSRCRAAQGHALAPTPSPAAGGAGGGAGTTGGGWGGVALGVGALALLAGGLWWATRPVTSPR